MSSSPVLVLGATGVLGQSLMREGLSLGHDMIGVARRGTPRSCDITDTRALEALWASLRPGIVINIAGCNDIMACENDPPAAYALHAHSVATMAGLARTHGSFLIQISTDQFYRGDGMRKHEEREPVVALTSYAASKLAGETLAATARQHLIIRTNYTGFRGWPDKPTLVEWVIDALSNHRAMTLLPDHFTSPLDTDNLSRILFDLIHRDARGLINVASRDVSSQAEFIEALAACFGLSLKNSVPGTVATCRRKQANSLGLDVTRAEAILNRPLPTLSDVVHALHRASLQLDGQPWTTTRLSA